MKITQLIVIFLIIEFSLQDNPWDSRTDITEFLQDQIRYENPEIYENGYIQISEMYPDNQTGLYYELVTKDGCDDINKITSKCGPLIIFIQGGPGYASSYANWQSIGPININNQQLSYQPYSWNTFASLLFIDQPINSGFSHVKNSKIKIDSIVDAANAMVFFMRKFYKRYPTMNQLPVVFFGEGYASHYISKFMEFFLDDDLLSEIEYLGIGTFGAWYHPVDNGNYYGNYLFSAGLISDATRKKMNQKQATMVQQLYQGNNAAVGPVFTYLTDISRNLMQIGDYNYEKTNDKNDTSFITVLTSFKSSLGIPSAADYVTFNSDLVANLVDDIGQSFLSNLDLLMSEDREVNFLFINGQLDVAFNKPGVEALINDLAWEDLPEFRKAQKQFYYKTVSGDQITTATLKTYEELSVATVYGAGHFAYNDKPDVVYQIVSDFITRITE